MTKPEAVAKLEQARSLLLEVIDAGLAERDEASRLDVALSRIDLVADAWREPGWEPRKYA